MSGPILVINPNSNQAVTDGLSAALARFRTPQGPAIECVTLAEGPFGIESQLDSDGVIVPLARMARARTDAAAIVIACYSDPGLDACRSVTKAPVFGIQESGVLAAMARADRFGVIAISSGSIARHRRTLMRMGVLGRMAAERPLDMSVADTAGAAAFGRLVEVGGLLVGDGAGALVLGCAGMARHRAPLEAALGVPVIDPTQAAVGMALATVLAAA